MELALDAMTKWDKSQRAKQNEPSVSDLQSNEQNKTE